MCERFHKTIEEFFYAGMRKSFIRIWWAYKQNGDVLLGYHHHERLYRGKYCDGKTPAKTFEEIKFIAF